jgi:pimeloyl-ACP methyl ester carboxylesterase
MQAPRRHGYAPFSVAILHGGPGAPGSAFSLADGLGSFCGVLEPFQNASDIDGLIAELKDQLASNLDLPAILIGHSWGAWLGFLFAARYPNLVKKLILVSSAPFEVAYIARIAETRLSRLGPEGRELLQGLIQGTLSGPKLKKVGALVARADAFDLLPNSGSEKAEPDPIQYERIWGQASELRKSGALLEAGRFIRCPVTAIHGDWDPHPADGVREPLERTLKHFRFVLMEKCGHEPWRERFASEKFFKILQQEIS